MLKAIASRLVELFLSVCAGTGVYILFAGIGKSESLVALVLAMLAGVGTQVMFGAARLAESLEDDGE